MASKRRPSSDVNQDNWDNEEEPEEQGTFQKACDEDLKRRVIKTAKRRNPIRSEDGEKKSAFMGFTGFSAKPSNTDFSFLSNISNTHSSIKSNGIDKSASSSTTSQVNMFSNTSTASSVNIFGGTPTVLCPSGTTNKSEKYCSKLKGLNESVSKWITKKVEENPLISLQPIFKDYEKYLDQIEKEESHIVDAEKPTSNSSGQIPTFNFTPSNDKNTKAIPDSTSEKNNETKEEKQTPTFSFGAPTNTVNTTIPTFSFGSTTKADNSATPLPSFGSTGASGSTNPTFSFGSNNSSSSSLTFPQPAGFSFGSNVKPTETVVEKNADDGNDNDEDEPPKVEFKPVVEKDHIYTVKCKVFVKKGDTFGDRGVGNLYLKNIENCDKVQLIVRADTNLGNLLLNLRLSESVPTKRLGKKDVMLVAIPTPDAPPPPVPLLVRVKSPEEADKLLDILEKHKK